VDGDTRRILETNPALQDMLGYTAEELRGMELHEIVAHDRASVEANIERTLKEGKRFIRERRYRRKNGSVVEVEIAASTISYGGKRAICAAIRDVTERKRAEEALREVREAERNRMARDLHDDVLQDLSYTAVSMEIMMIEAEGTSLEKRLQEAIDAVRRAAQGLRYAVNDLRLEDEGDRPLPILLERLVERNSAMARGQTLGLYVEEGFPSEPLGKAGVEVLRIVQEALTNARRHSGASNIQVKLRVEEVDLVVEVTDEGRGFAPGAVPGVGSRSMRERAMGIGGKVEIESASGQGTRVHLRVPLSQKG
jgi:PAS domain S-box-containing protein